MVVTDSIIEMKFSQLRTNLEAALHEQKQIALSGIYDVMTGEIDDLPIIDSLQKDFLEDLMNFHLPELHGQMERCTIKRVESIYTVFQQEICEWFGIKSGEEIAEALSIISIHIGRLRMKGYRDPHADEMDRQLTIVEQKYLRSDAGAENELELFWLKNICRMMDIYMKQCSCHRCREGPI
ncbi:hypothetical protein N7456_002855 [Penicillium angulare]|uniref:Uncharacterized protein n=1 Tax=Penicillium angulare TaxID=116970 RepID=A0A9W9FTL2_9EURO|nr:hypothetical protein N7456_002855 [Penicillium angulare]